MAIMERALGAYDTLDNPAKSEKASEFDVFARVTSNLRSATQDQPKAFGCLVKAVDENRRLWTAIASSVTSSDNTLSEDLKAQLFFLFEFTIAHSRKVLKKEADPSALIDVNVSVMRGLKPMAIR